MERVKIGQYVWEKSVGDEGQDVYVAQFIVEDDEVMGKYVDESSYDILVDSDCDFYLPSSHMSDEDLNEDRIAFKFRKDVFTKEEQIGCYEGLYGAAVESNNRGLAAGPREESQGNRDWVTSYQQDVMGWYEAGQPPNIDGTDPLTEFANALAEDEIRGGVWLRTKVEPAFGSYKEFFPKLMSELAGMSIEEATVYAKKIRTEFISDTSYATAIWSGIAGFYGRYPRIPYGRATAFTDHHRTVYEKCYPFARKLEERFKQLLPVRHGRQLKCAEKVDPKFLIGEDTTFTTITVNTTTKDRNARMACHRDAGSLNEGFSNLTVISDGEKDWKGGYLVCPEVRAAINCRPGDLLLVDNMRVIHGNTPIEAPESGEDDLMRMSLIFYFREDMMKLGSWEYEHLRRAYVDSRRLNEEHALWRPYWNGVSPDMFTKPTDKKKLDAYSGNGATPWQEWFDYLTDHGGEDMLRKYHPEAFESAGSLEDFFG